MWSPHLFQDVRYAARLLRKTPLFTAAAVLILGCAIGSNLAVFRLIDALMLRAIPVAKPDELVRLELTGPEGRLSGMPSTVVDVLRQEPAFSGTCGFTTPRVTTEIDGLIASTGTLSMTGDCFRTLGVATQIGRSFSAADDLPEAPNVVVLTARMWRSTFNGDPAVLGRQLRAGSEAYTVIGVASDDFTGVLLGFEPGLILPLHHMPSDGPQRRYAWYWVSVFARRAPGVPQAAAAARLQTIGPRILAESVPMRYNQAQQRNYFANHFLVSPARTGVDWMLRARFGPPLYALWGICGAILLIGVLNLSGMLLARTLARQKETGIRLAIGGGRWRVVRPLAMESLLLSAAGSIAGILLASLACRLIVSQASVIFGNFTIDTSPGPRDAVLVAATALVVVMALVAPPLWQTRRVAGGLHLWIAGRGIVGGAARGQKTLMALQVSFTVALVAATGVFASSFRNLAHLRLGVRTEGVSEAMLSTLPGAYGASTPGPYYEDLLRRVESLPGVRRASLSSFALYWNKMVPDLVRSIDGSREARAQIIRATDGYFATLGMRLTSGEDFARNRAQPEAIVSESVARLLGGNGNPVGTSIAIGDSATARQYRIIGIAPTVRISMADARDANPMVVYLNFWQEPREQRWPDLYIEGAVDVKALEGVVRGMGREYVEEYRTLEAARDESIVEDRLMAYLSGVFGLFALLLAATGLFAILSCYVSRRTSEIGLRVALGATGAQVRGVVLAQIGPVLLAGIAGGLALATITGRTLAAVAFGVSPADPVTTGGAVVSMAITAMLAAWIPARRAALVQPIEALRQE